MGLIININNITGSSPFDIYICQENGSGCFYINTITSTPYQFIIPPPYDTSFTYIIKIIDSSNCEVNGVINMRV
jgi:hypothetical protein